MQPLVRRLKGTSLPKQYVNFVGTQSMLEHTFSRADRLLPAPLLFTVSARRHLLHPEARTQLASRSHDRVILQPANRDTLPGLLLPLLRLRHAHPDATIAVFPSDHCILEEERFLDLVRAAFREVERRPRRTVLLGVEPTGVETEYGYIVPERCGRADPGGALTVRRFVEKPGRAEAEDLIREGALWNTLVLVFRAASFLALVEKFAPAALVGFRGVVEAFDTPRERAAVEEAYRRMPSRNLSKDLLEVVASEDPGSLLVLPGRDLNWSDWGSERRIFGGVPRFPRGKVLTMRKDTHAKKERYGAGGASPLSDEQLHDLIARRAYELYETRGCRDGHDTEDWLEAEKLILDDLMSEPERPRVHRERRPGKASGARSAS